MYCDREQLARYGLPPKALSRFTPEEIDRSLEAASAVVDGYLRARYTLPIAYWGLDLTRCVATIAAYDLMMSKGFDPNLAADEQLRLRYEDSLAWLKMVRKAEVDPDIIDTKSPDITGSRPSKMPLEW